VNSGADYGIHVMMVSASGTVHNSVWIDIAAWPAQANSVSFRRPAINGRANFLGFLSVRQGKTISPQKPRQLFGIFRQRTIPNDCHIIFCSIE